MGSAEVGGKIFLTTNVLLKYEKVRINVKKDNNELMEHFFKLHSKWSQNAITVREELAMQYRSLEKAMKMDSTALMEHFLSLLIGESSTVKEEYPDESLDSLTSQPTQSVSIGEASTPPVMEYHNTSLSQDGSTSASPRNLVQIRDTALCSTSSIAAIKNPGALYTNNQSSCVPTVHIPLDSGVLLPHLSGTSSFSHTFSQKRKLSSSSDGDVPASKIPGIQHHIHHLHPPQSSGEPLQQESIPDRRSLIEGTTGQHLFGYQTGSTRNDYGKPSATFSLQDVEQQQNHGLRTAALPSDLSKDSRRDISKTALDFIEGVSQLTSVDNVHSLRLSVDRVSMGSIVGSEPLERQNVLGMNMSPQFAKGLRQNRVSMDNSVNIHPQPGTSGVNQNISGSMTEFDLSAVKIEVNSDEDLEDVSHESGDQEALAAMVTDAEGKIWRKAPGDTLASESRFHQFYMGNKEPSRNRGLLFRLPPPKKNKSSRSHPDFLSFVQIKNSLNFSQVDWSYFYSAQKSWSIKEKFEYLYSIIDRKFEKPLIRIQASFHLGYYVCKYEELDRVECFSVIRKHMSLRHARNYRLLYRELGCYRTLAHCTVPTRHIIMRVKYVRDLIKSQSQEEIQFLMFPPNRDPYQFLKAYEEWYSLKESAVYQLGLPDNHCGSSVIEQNTQKFFMDITKEGMWMIENFLNNSAEEDKYLLMYNKGNSGNCIVLHRNKSGKFSLEDDRLQCLKNMEPEDKVHLLAIK